MAKFHGKTMVICGEISHGNRPLFFINGDVSVIPSTVYIPVTFLWLNEITCVRSCLILSMKKVLFIHPVYNRLGIAVLVKCLLFTLLSN